mmetsp:Transcript_13305/g.36671  ORF Transcript_13305/g.36671 Transcript_13305/m.36671 type:complete len:211 (+) Transcript_13305:1396-2028(+)
MMLRICPVEWSGPFTLQLVVPTLPTSSSNHLAMRWWLRPFCTTCILTSRTCPFTTSWRVSGGRRAERLAGPLLEVAAPPPLSTTAVLSSLETLPLMALRQKWSATPRKYAWKATKCTCACSVLGAANCFSVASLAAPSSSSLASSSTFVERSCFSILSRASIRHSKMSRRGSLICMPLSCSLADSCRLVVSCTSAVYPGASPDASMQRLT